jgi:hypothetical protein
LLVGHKVPAKLGLRGEKVYHPPRTDDLAAAEGGQMPDTKDKIITAISKAGQTDFGHSVLFELSYSNGPAEMFRCRADLLPKLLTGLVTAGSFAAQTRSSQPGSLIDVATPVRMTKPTRTGQTKDGTIVFEFGCDMGFPMQVSMPRDHAEKTIELLQAELGRSAPMESRN